jgi:hypothetical protein
MAASLQELRDPHQKFGPPSQGKNGFACLLGEFTNMTAGLIDSE